MLQELLVENYAVVEKLRLRFHPGLNVLTGETGSGKSIVVDALGLLFGSRTSAEMLRSGADRARITGVFDWGSEASEILAEAGIDSDNGELLVEREILANGKSRAFVNNKPVTVALLRELSGALGDIHGQHDQQRLFSASAQLDILDAFAGSGARLDKIRDVYVAWKGCAEQIADLDRSEQEKLRLLDLWKFQRDEIDAAGLSPGEDEALEAERKVLGNVGRLLENAGVAYEALYDAPESISTQMRLVLKKLDELARIDAAIEPLSETLKPAQVAIEEAADALRHYIGKLEADPDRLEEVESRLAALGKLKRKYGSTVEEILAFAEEVRTQILGVETSAERRAELERKRKELASAYEVLASGLTAHRKAAALQLGKRVQDELKSLAMERTAFEVRLEPAPWSAVGSDAVQFFISPNLGETARPLDKIASGGELSRVALALKSCVTGDIDRRTLVFDEVDAGIGGAAADSVARKLKGIASRNQVLCVTHLAQIAGFADHHYAVEKKEVKGRTQAQVEELTGDARTREIGRMLSGQRLTPEALKHAEQLIRTSTV